jgi:hypothetical protein
VMQAAGWHPRVESIKWVDEVITGALSTAATPAISSSLTSEGQCHSTERLMSGWMMLLQVQI